MQITAAVLYDTTAQYPYRDSQPLKIETIELDDPQHEEVLIKILASGLCHSDLSVMNGTLVKPMPIVLGHESVGIVEKCGTGVTGFAVGDTVIPSFVPCCSACSMCKQGKPAMCINATQGSVTGTLLGGVTRLHKNGQKIHHQCGVSGFADYAVVSMHSLVKIGTDIPHEHAALFGCGVMTGAGAVINTSGITIGDTVAVIGVGGVGLSAIMAAVASGATKVIAVDVNDDKLKTMSEFGATHTFNAGDPTTVEKINTLTGGGAQIVIETAGVPSALETAVAITGAGGTTVVAGLPAPDKTANIPHYALSKHEKTIKGSFMGSCVPSRDIPKLLAMYQQGTLPIDKLANHSITLEEVNEAFDLMVEGKSLRTVINF